MAVRVITGGGGASALVREDDRGENSRTLSSADLHVLVRQHLSRTGARTLDGTGVKGSPLTLLRFLPKIVLPVRGSLCGPHAP